MQLAIHTLNRILSSFQSAHMFILLETSHPSDGRRYRVRETLPQTSVKAIRLVLYVTVSSSPRRSVWPASASALCSQFWSNSELCFGQPRYASVPRNFIWSDFPDSEAQPWLGEAGPARFRCRRWGPAWEGDGRGEKRDHDAGTRRLRWRHGHVTHHPINMITYYGEFLWLFLCWKGNLVLVKSENTHHLFTSIHAMLCDVAFTTALRTYIHVQFTKNVCMTEVWKIRLFLCFVSPYYICVYI